MLRRRNPHFRLEFVTDEESFTIRYSADIDVSGDYLASKIIAFQTKNAMQDDSAVFQITLAGDIAWDKVLNVNDIMRLYVDAGDSMGEGLILVGMISQVSKLGEYGNNQVAYRVTGQSFSKPFLKFGLGIIQEVQAFLPSTGWLIDGEDISFTGKNATEIMKGVLDHFVKYMKYQFNDGGTRKSINDFFTWNTLDSWTMFESLTDATQFTNFDGSLKQMMDLATAKPFNESFFRNSADMQKTEFVLRRTPFNQADWVILDYELVSTEDVVSEDVGKSDVETYSIFTVTTPKLFKTLDQKIFSKPQYHEKLTDRYGYSLLEVENIYVNLDDGVSSSDTETNTNKDAGERQVTYERVVGDLNGLGRDNVATDKNGVISRLSSTYRGLTKAQATKIVDKYIKNGSLTADDYGAVTKQDPLIVQEEDNRPLASIDAVKALLKGIFKTNKNFTDKDLEKNKDKAKKELASKFRYGSAMHANKLVEEYVKYMGTPPEDEAFKTFVNALQDINTVTTDTGTDASDSAMLTFSKMLFNWFYNNPNFFAGDIVLLGHHKYDVGKRLFVEDKQHGDVWEFYIESVEHNFDFKKGYYTVVGVTRGLKEATLYTGSPHRFQGLWGQSKDFVGGLLGEKRLSDMKAEAVQAKEANKSSGGNSGGNTGASGDWGKNSGVSLKTLEKYKGALPKWDFKTRPGNPHDSEERYRFQCTWYAWNRRAQLGVPIPSSGWGNAGDWKPNSISAGYSGGSTPKRGAIVVWDYGAESGMEMYGHVAIVEAVRDGGKTIDISEYNYGISRAYGERTISVKDYMYFVY